MLRRFTALTVLSVGLVLAAGPVIADDTTDSTEAQVTGVELRWGMTNEANNAAHAPGTWNFFSAGKIPNPGKGNVKLNKDDWKQSDGDVAIEKWDGSAYKDATWEGLSTDSNGKALTGSGPYSNHQFVFSKGTGTVDRAAGTAHLEWDGDVSVLFYSGYTFFYLSDPVLDVANGKGTLKATLSGYGGSQTDPSAWEEVEPRTVTVADLPSVSLTTDGFTVTPDFDDVTVNTTTCAKAGSFPRSFIGFHEELGTAAFWCRTGSGTDDAKAALPVTVSFDGSAAAPEPTTEPTPTPAPSMPATPGPSTDVTDGRSLTNAELRWGMTNEANNAAHAPGTWNFFSAGKIPNPGKGNTELKSDDWKQADGNVAIEKWDGSAYKNATWNGLSTDSNGNAINSADSGRYSNHQFVFGAGTGAVNAQKGEAHIEWKGDVSVLFYSGYTFFYLSDPVLDVANGKGALTATLSGYGGTRNDPSAWEEVDPKTVTVADFTDVSLSKGFTVTPAFDNVKVTTNSCKNSGSFPKSFIDFHEDLGTAAFWCTSGSTSDDAKKALPLTVSFDASDPVSTSAPDDTDSADDVTNDAPGFVASLPAAVGQAARAVSDAISVPLRLVASRLDTDRSYVWALGAVLWAQAAMALAAALRVARPVHRQRSDG